MIMGGKIRYDFWFSMMEMFSHRLVIEKMEELGLFFSKAGKYKLLKVSRSCVEVVFHNSARLSRSSPDFISYWSIYLSKGTIMPIQNIKDILEKHDTKNLIPRAFDIFSECCEIHNFENEKPLVIDFYFNTFLYARIHSYFINELSKFSLPERLAFLRKLNSKNKCNILKDIEDILWESLLYLFMADTDLESLNEF